MAVKKLVIPPKRYQGITSVVSARLPKDSVKDLMCFTLSNGT